MLNYTTSTSVAFVVGDQKVCTQVYKLFKELQQTFWNTNNGGRRYNIYTKKGQINNWK